jgi:hypothetical protein
MSYKLISMIRYSYLTTIYKGKAMKAKAMKGKKRESPPGEGFQL